MTPLLEVFTVPPFGENTYLVGDADTGEAIVIDPGGRVDDILTVAAAAGLKITQVVNTHAHVDHVLGVAALCKATGAPFWLHRDAAPMAAQVGESAEQYGLPPAEQPVVDGFLVPGENVTVGNLVLEVRYTPGHAPGHVTLFANDAQMGDARAPIAFVGDVIFLGGIGRTDLAGGNFETLMASIENEILTMPDETVLYSGHGPATTVGHERHFNPFVTEWRAARGTP